MIEGILNGLCYLHSMGVVHGDMKAASTFHDSTKQLSGFIKISAHTFLFCFIMQANILISPDGCPLLMDFGLSHLLISTSTMETATGATNGTTRWMAPELLLLDTANAAEAEDGGAAGSVESDYEVHTKQSDVWAFGMTALELLTKQVPYAKLKSDAKVMFAIHAKTMPSKPEGLENWEVIDRKLWELCKMCWVFNPLERPDASQLSDELKRIREESKGNLGVVVQVL
ncbi:kinase-like domain-containing protein [Phellopilus nigrolimitatus]|nr:kinase-like domain-containing protein [Phellopilus nigrolimitatus]